MERENFEKLLDDIFEYPDCEFGKFLNLALELWDYRVKERNPSGSSYGIEYIFQTYIVKKLLDFLKGNNEYNLYFSEKIPNFLEFENENIQPDIVITKNKREIKIIMEIKSIENGCLNWIFSSNGTERDKSKGDILKLRKIKEKHSGIICYELVINRGDWNAKCWANTEYQKLKKENSIEERKEWKFSKNLSCRLIEILK